jgi:D-amino-acid dehydrogenase
MQASLRLTLYSQEVGARLREDAGLDSAEYDHARRGAIKVFMSEAAFAEARHLGETLASWGLDVRPVDRDTCAALEPGLAKRAETIAGGLHFPNEETGDCRLFTRAMRRRGEAAGVSFRFGTTVQGLEVASGKVVTVTTDKGRIEPDAVVAALASYSPPLLAKVGLRVPVCPVKGVTVTLPAAPWPDAVRGAVMDHSRLYGFIRIGERLRIAGSAEITGYDTVPAKARCQALIDNALQLFPDFRLCLDAAEPVLWAGVRAVAPDGPPILGPTPIANLFLNTGHGPQGWSTAAGCARLVADLVSGHKPEITTDGLTLARFAA